MIDSVSIAATVWPALFVVGVLPIYFMTASRAGVSDRGIALGGVAAVVGLGCLYLFDPLRVGLRWVLTIVGFAVPLAVGVLSVRYLVAEA